MDLGLEGRVAVVTGGSRGLGLATARALVREGAHVVLNGRDEAVLDEAAQGLRSVAARGAEVVTEAGSLADPELAARLVARARTEFGGLHACLVSVGGPPAGPDAAITDEQWRLAFDTVFLGMRRVARTCADAMLDGGAVGLVLSTTVREPLAALATSNGLRPGLAMLAEQMADEHAPRGVRVLCLLPGRFDTERVQELDAATGDAEAARSTFERTIPLGRYGDPQEFGDVAAFLLSPRASFMTGTAVAVDGGASRHL